jgi:hypothetical protein
MNPLITLQDIREIKSISLNLNSNKELDPHILEAQDFDLRPLMGDNFFLDFLEDFEDSPSLSQYSDLWNGCTYTFQNEKFKHEGLKAVLAYHSFARYTSEANIQSTPTGFVHKTNQYSEKVEDKAISRKVAQARSAAQICEGRVIDYICRHKSLYPLYKGNNQTKKYSSGMKIRSIG